MRRAGLRKTGLRGNNMNNVQLEQIGIVMILVGLVAIGKIICEELSVNKLIAGTFWMISAIITTIILIVAGQ